MSCKPLRSQILEVGRIIQENVTEDTVKTYNMDQQFRFMSRSIGSGNVQSYIKAEEYFRTECPDFDYNLKYIQQDPEGNSMLHNSCLNQRLSIAKHLLASENYQINSLNKQGLTPLWMQVMNIFINRRFNQELFDLLLSKGANILLRDSLNRSILQIFSLIPDDFPGKEYISEKYKQANSAEGRRNFIMAIIMQPKGDWIINKLNKNELKEVMKFI